MTLPPAIQALIAAMPQADQLGFFQFWEAVYQARYTGPITVDCLNGEPKQFSLGRPVTFSIVQGLDSAAKAP